MGNHCMRDPSVMGACAGPNACSCECNTCDPPVRDDERQVVGGVRRMVTSRCKHDLLVADCGTCGPDRLRDAKTTRPKHGETYPDGPGEESRLRAENERLREQADALKHLVNAASEVDEAIGYRDWKRVASRGKTLTAALVLARAALKGGG